MLLDYRTFNQYTRILPYHTIFNHLSFWKEGEVRIQSESLIQMGKTCANNSKHTCKVILLTKHDGSKILFGDYRPFN
jgi:hypothetical protein